MLGDVEATDLGLSACTLKFNLQRSALNFIFPNLQNLFYYGLANRFCTSLKNEKTNSEKKRISKIWK